jgi:hypothetical protein
MKPDGMSEEIYKRYQSDGFTELDIERIWQDTLYFRHKMAINSEKPDREITCSTYERAQKNLKRNVDNWFRKL